MRTLSALAFICLIWGVLSDRCEDEAPLPARLPVDQHGGEYHLHGHFRVPLNASRFVTFTLTQESFFRAYLGGHEMIDVDMYLQNQTSYLAFSIEFNTEEMIALVLKPGDYKLEITPFITSTNQALANLECQFVQMEFAVAPVTVVLQREAAYTFGPVSLPGPFNLDSLSQGGSFDFPPAGVVETSAPPFNVKVPYNGTRGAPSVTVLAKFPLNLTPKAGTNPIFKFSASLGYSFLTSGSLRILLETANQSFTGDYPQCLTNRDECLSGVNEGQNINTISTTLGSGWYTLWIYDRTENRMPRPDAVADGFSFSLHISQLHSDETLVSCDSLPLPKNWSTPGLIDDTGYMSFREPILLDIGAQEESATFRVPFPFLFRAWTEAHRVDVDFQVKKGDSILARTYRGAGREESVIMKLEANTTYTFSLKYYSSLNEIFCEKIWMEIMIQPLTPYYALPYCSGKANTAPVFPSLVNTSMTVKLPPQDYFYAWKGISHTENIASVRITPAIDMFVNAYIQTQFLDGLHMDLQAVNASRSFALQSGRGYQRITGILSAGKSYQLVIAGGPHQFNPNLVDFPPCAFFRFEFALEPFSIGGILGLDRICHWLPTVPTDLSGPAYFGTSNRVHFQDFFAIPSAVGFETSQSITFTVRTRSLFRAYTEPRNHNDVDIDFAMLENGVLLNHTVKEYGEEKITQILTPGKTYVFKIIFYADFSLVPLCSTFNLELEIAPLHPSPPEPCLTILPITDPINIRYIVREYQSEAVYSFAQSRAALSKKIPLLISSRNAVSARFIIAYDFVWSALSIRIVDQRDGKVLALGDNDYNKNQILGVRLASGNYTIEIFEPAALEDEELRHCSEFLLQIGIAPPHEDMFPDIDDVEDEDNPDCQKLFLPATFDSIAYLSHLSDYSFHSAGMVRVHKEGSPPSEAVDFTITKPSFLRVYVPAFDLFDVDIYVWSIKQGAGTVRDRTLARSTAYKGDEQIFLPLDPGRYQLEFRLFFMPTQEFSCLAFPAEYGIISADRLSIYKVQQPSVVCNNDTTRLGPLVIGKPYSNAMTRTTSNKAYLLTTSFNLTQPSLFIARLEYPFFTGHLDFNLQGKNILSPFLSVPSDRDITAFIGQDTAFFDTVLYPGTYTLDIEDEVTNYTQVFCNQFNLQYQLFPGYVPENYCDDADTLPTDTFSYPGRSRFYGGPQKLDGSVHISGAHFIIPPYRSHNYMEFYVNKPSFVRVWAKFEDEVQNDIDFLIWQNKSKKTLLVASAGIESTESHTLFLPAQPDPYLLDTFVYSRSNQECHFLHFEFVVETNQSIIEDMLCPVPLPSPLLPPSEVHITTPQFLFFGDHFIFTSEYINTHSVSRYYYDEVTYTITISIEDNYRYDISSAVGFNFVWSDYSLELWQGSSRKALSTDGLSLSQDAWDDFRSSLETSLETGTYQLKIIERIFAKEAKANMAGTCEKFSFSLNIERVGDPDATFRIVSVTPPSGNELQPDHYLKIEILFSNPLGTNSHSSDLAQWIQSSEAVYLSQPFRRMYPVLASWNRAQTLLTVSFIGLKLHETWQLNITSSVFFDSQGVPLRPYNQMHTYVTLSCDCHGRGRCAASNETRPGCVCTAPYAGTDCTLCLPGYHRAGTECQQDTHCTTNSCNGHGACSDRNGYPVCECDKGYESTGAADGACSVCHAGYSGYPNCALIEDSRALHCEAPLLPGTLDSVAYLAVDGQLHLQGDYYLDVNHFGHDMRFTIERDSFFRVYTEPHEVDIDLWLFKTEEDREVVVNYAISFNQEETMFLRLTPGVYRLTFQFLLFREYTTCPTFNLELAVEPVTDFVNLVNKYRTVCKQTDNLPQIPLVGGAIPVTGPWSYTPADIWTVNSLNRESKNRTFWNWEFTVPSLEHRALQFQVDLGYRFITGDLASYLQELQGSSWEQVGFGYNGYNQHFLRHNLDGGRYRLSLYLPAPANESDSPCSPFTLKITTQWITQDEDIFNCDYSQIPTSLDSITLRGEKDHVIVNDEFLIQEWDDNTLFTVPTTSLIRVFASAPVSFHYQLEQKAASGNNWTILERDTNNELFYDGLIPGVTYRIRYQFTYFSFRTFCPTLRLSISIMSTADFLEPFQSITCTGRQTGSLPQLPSGHYNLPFEFSGLTAESKEAEFYAFKDFGTTVGTWSISFSDNTYFSATVGSDFIVSNLKLSITTPYNQVYTSVKTTLHSSTLTAELNPGNYTITLSQPPRTFLSPSCTPFSFKMKALPLAAWKQDLCNGKGDELPTTFNSLQFTGGRNDFRLFSDQWKMPSELNNSTFVLSKQISFTASKESLLRLYIGVHVVDIDVALYSAQNPSNSIARGADLLGEESFVAKIIPGDYFIRLLFWNLRNEIPPCPTFNMELVMEDVEDLPDRKKLCTDGGSAPELWPTLPKSISDANLPFQGSYVGFYQQVDHSDYTHSIKTYTLDFTTSVDVHIEVGYNFLLSDLVITLSGLDGVVRHGINKATTNVLNAKELGRGTYTLSIHEATQNHKDFIACSDFTISLLIAKAATTDARDEADTIPFPTSLAGIEYLMFSDEVHIHEQRYLMDLGGNIFQRNSPVLKINVQTPSLLRVATGLIDPVTLSMGQPDEPRVRDLVVRLAPGSHNVTFHLLSQFQFSRYLVVNIQLALEPITGAETFVTEQCSTPRAIWNPPHILVRPSDGLYQYNEYHARLLGAQLQDPSLDSKLYVLPFEITEESIVSVQIHYQFITGHLTASIFDSYSTRTGIDDWNLNDLNAMLLPGKFNLTINRPAVFPTSLFALGCGEFGLRISISPKGSNADRVDCSDAAIFPWDFNSPIGGSNHWGGPMASGSLNIWGDKFLLNGGTGSLSAKFNTQTPSIVSLFVHQHVWSRLDLQIIDAENNQVVTSTSRQSNFYQALTSYKLENTASHDYSLKVGYQPNDWQACSTFTFAMAIHPFDEIVSALENVCTLRGAQVLPPSRLTNTSLQISSYFTAQDFTQRTSDGTFTYEMEFSITQDSAFDAAISFNPLVSLFGLRLLSRQNANLPYRQIVTGEWVPVEGSASELTQIIDFDAKVAESTDYKLVIIQPSTSQSPFSSLTQRLCWPFRFSMQLEKLQGKDTAFVRYVEPGSGDRFDPRREIWVELRFSHPLYQSGNQPLTRDAVSAAYVANSIQLTRLDTPQSSLKPIKAMKPPANPTFDDLTRWMFQFSPDGFTYGASYKLELVPHRLYSPDQTEMRLSTNHIYSMSPENEACSKFGHWNGKICVCDALSHRVGPTCGECDAGFVFDDAQNCVRPGACEANTCGCGPSSTPTHCIPVGTCSVDSSNKIVCLCPPAYSGSRCERCAQGFANKSGACAKDCDPPCQPGAGVCNVEAGTCTCKGNFVGTTCSSCKPGFMGANCDSESGSILAKVVGILLGALCLIFLVAVVAWYWRMRSGSQYEQLGDDFMDGMSSKNNSVQLEQLGDEHDSASDSGSADLNTTNETQHSESKSD